jgi:sugar-specific transcriptional regulator TrmB
MVVNIIKKLGLLGLSEYEAKAYIALLQSHPATAYETAKMSGLPTSKIYEVLSRLAEKKMVLEMVENARKRYIPQEPEEVITTYKNRIDSTLESLSRDLLVINKETNVSYIWNISDYEDFLEKAKSVVLKAKESILLSVWHEEFIHLADLIEEKSSRVQLAIIHFGKPKVNLGQMFAHPIEDTLYAEKGGRGFTLVADRKECLMGTVFKDNMVQGAWSRNDGFVMLAEDYIKHDIYIMKIVNRFNDLLVERFGPNYVKLRDIFHDEEEVKK